MSRRKRGTSASGVGLADRLGQDRVEKGLEDGLEEEIPKRIQEILRLRGFRSHGRRADRRPRPPPEARNLDTFLAQLPQGESREEGVGLVRSAPPVP